MSLTLKGQEHVMRRLQAIAANAPRDMGAALFRQGEKIMTRSKQEFVPVDTGVLRQSGHVQLPVQSGNEVSVTLAYGGPAEAYALIQHERMDYNHSVGGPKYLERPVLEAAPRLAADLAADLGVEKLVR